MKTIKWIKILISLIVIFKTNYSFSSVQIPEIPNDIRFELSNPEYNKYMRRSMKAYTDGEIFGKRNIKKKYKKWINANLLIGDKKIKTKIRILGDLKDHLRLPETSLKVKVVDESYFGVTRFNLFLPETRRGENEVFWTLMLHTLKFPTLFTKMIEVNLNGNVYKAIFQEDATKEFLERNSLTETVILKNNDYGFYLNEYEKNIYENIFSSSFVIDNNNFLKNDTSNFIASEAIALKANKNFKELVFMEDFFVDIHEKFAKHGLAEINRKYIYIPYSKKFLPLYYDGNIQFLPGKTTCDSDIEIKILQNFQSNYFKLTNKKLSKMQKCVFKDIYKLYKTKSIKESQKISFNSDKKKVEKYKNIKDEILIYLNNKNISKSSNFTTAQNKGVFYSFIYNDKFYKCFFNFKKDKIQFCKQIKSSEYKKLISESGEFLKINKFKSFPINLGVFNNELDLEKLKEVKQTYILNKPKTYVFNFGKIEDQSLNFLFEDENSRLIIRGEFNKVNFDFKNNVLNANKKLSSSRYDKNLLTGCVNYFDTKFANVSISSYNMFCEDSVNIKNSLGFIKKIKVENSFFDALDLDFSKLDIENIIVNGANNDCVDVSFGNYLIRKATLSNCGDKGLSIGEKSKLNLDNGIISFSNIGIASKDSAVTNVDKLQIQQSHICLSAYKKKREFNGSKVFVKNFDCKKYKIRTKVDKFSKIDIKNETY